MGNVLALLFMFLLTLASVAGYLFLTEIVIAGERQIAGGQRRLKKDTPRSKRAKPSWGPESERCQRARRITSKPRTTCS
jgi:hypothetical protein